MEQSCWAAARLVPSSLLCVTPLTKQKWTPFGECGSDRVTSSSDFPLCFVAATAATANVPATGPTALKTEAPSFLRRPLAVSGIPIVRETRDLNADIPSSLFHEKPPK